MTIKKIATSLLTFVLLFIVFTTDSFAAATLSLSPVSGSFTTGQTFDVTINLNTGGVGVSAVDAVINFDQTKLQLVEVVDGTIFQQYVDGTLNNTNGSFQSSGLASSQQTIFTGTGVFSTLRFKAYSPGTANVTIVFTAGSTTDSNVAEYSTAQDILGSVTNAQYTVSGTPIAIGSASTGTTTSTTTTTATPATGIGGAGSLSPTNSVPVTATSFPTLALIAFGILFIFTGYFASQKFFK